MVVKGTRNIVKDPTSLKDKVKILYKFREMFILKFANMTEPLTAIHSALTKY